MCPLHSALFEAEGLNCSIGRLGPFAPRSSLADVTLVSFGAESVGDSGKETVQSPAPLALMIPGPQEVAREMWDRQRPARSLKK